MEPSPTRRPTPDTGSNSMIAAIYARKSTDDSDRNEDARSTSRQIERAREYAALKGWAVDEHHIFSDDAVSGAEWLPRRLTRNALGRDGSLQQGGRPEGSVPRRGHRATPPHQ